jgi:hypothetical protein
MMIMFPSDSADKQHALSDIGAKYELQECSLKMHCPTNDFSPSLLDKA